MYQVSKPMLWIVMVIVAFLGIVVGRATEEPSATPVVTTTTEPVVVATFTPTTCRTAITAAREAFGLYAELAQAASASVTGAAEGDLVAMKRQGAVVSDIGSRMDATAPRFTAAAERCESG